MLLSYLIGKLPKISFRTKKHAERFADYLRWVKKHKVSVRKHPDKNCSSKGYSHVVILKKGNGRNPKKLRKRT